MAEKGMTETQAPDVELRPSDGGDSSSICSDSSSFLPILAIIIVTFSAATSAYRARSDPWALSFIAFAYANLVALFHCVRMYEKLLPDGSKEKKKQLRVAVWILATTLNFAFAWRTSDLLPCFMAVIIWSMSIFVAVVGLCALFLCSNRGVVDVAAGSDMKNRNGDYKQQVLYTKLTSSDENV